MIVLRVLNYLALILAVLLVFSHIEDLAFISAFLGLVIVVFPAAVLFGFSKPLIIKYYGQCDWGDMVPAIIFAFLSGLSIGRALDESHPCLLTGVLVLIFGLNIVFSPFLHAWFHESTGDTYMDE